MLSVHDVSDYPRWVWDDVLDALHERANQEWERDRPEIADALTEVAETLAKQPAVAAVRGEL